MYYFYYVFWPKLKPHAKYVYLFVLMLLLLLGILLIILGVFHA